MDHVGLASPALHTDSPSANRLRRHFGDKLAGRVRIIFVSIGRGVKGLAPSAILHRALDDAARAATVQFQVQTREAGINQHVGGVVGPHEGMVTISSSTGQSQIIVKGGVAYIESDGPGLQVALGVSGSAASTLSGKWVAVHTGETPYDQLTAAASLTSTLAEFTPGGATARDTTQTISGHSVVLILGSGTGSSPVQAYTVQMAVTAQSVPLPIAGVVTIKGNGKTATQQADFERWGRRIHVNAPTTSITFSTVGGGSETG